MQTVKGTVVDEANGGKVINGIIIGAKKTVVKYEVEGRLYDTKKEAQFVELGHELNAAIYDILGLDLFAKTGNRIILPNSVVGIIRDNAIELKKILQKPKYAILFEEQVKELKDGSKVQQEKEEVVRDFQHLRIKEDPFKTLQSA